MATKPVTPKDLQDAGYRIELGESEKGVPDELIADLIGKYWWTWAGDNCASIDSSTGEWDTPEEAVADAYRDMHAIQRANREGV